MLGQSSRTVQYSTSGEAAKQHDTPSRLSMAVGASNHPKPSAAFFGRSNDIARETPAPPHPALCQCVCVCVQASAAPQGRDGGGGAKNKEAKPKRNVDKAGMPNGKQGWTM